MGRLFNKKIIWCILAVVFVALAGPHPYALAASPDPHVIFLGDSLTAGGQWPLLFPGPWIKNAGVVGDTTAQVLERLDPVIRSRPDKVFVMAGINDLAAGVHPPVILDRLRTIVKRLLKESPGTGVYLQSLLPVNNELCGDLVDVRIIAALNRDIERMARETGVVFIDLYSAFSTPGGQLNPAYTRDGVHLTFEAYDVWKSEIERYVDDAPAPRSKSATGPRPDISLFEVGQDDND